MGATPKREWGTALSVLDRLDEQVGDGAVVCLCREPAPLTGRVTAVPVGAR